MLVAAGDHPEPVLHRVLQSLSVAKPDLDDHVLVDDVLVVHVDLLPRDGLSLSASHHGVHAIHEVSIGVIRCEVLLLHPLHYVVHLVPARCVHLVASDVEELSREHSILLRADQVVQHLLDRLERDFATGIERGLAVFAGTHLRLYTSLCRPTPTSNTPRLGVSRDVHFSDHVDTPTLRVGHDVLDVVLAVPLHLGVRSIPHRRHGGRGHGEGLVIDQMPVEHVQLHPRHGVDDALDGAQREVVARGVDHERAVGEEGTVLDAVGRVLDDVRVGLVVVLDQEHERIQGVVGAVDVRSRDLDRRPIVRDGQRVALVLGDLVGSREKAIPQIRRFFPLVRYESR